MGGVGDEVEHANALGEEIRGGDAQGAQRMQRRRRRGPDPSRSHRERTIERSDGVVRREEAVVTKLFGFSSWGMVG